MKKIDLYILKNLTVNFIVFLIIVSLIMMIGNAIKIYSLLFAKGETISIILKIMGYMTIFLSIFTIPMALTLSVNFVYTSLSKNSEIVILKSAGISLLRIYLPAFIFSIFIFLILFYDSSFLVRKAKLAYRKTIISVVKNRLYVGIKEKTFYDGLKGATIYVNGISPDHKKLNKVFFAKNSNTVIAAKHAYFVDTLDGFILRFKDASLYSETNNNINTGTFKVYDIDVGINNTLNVPSYKGDTRFMNIVELYRYFKKTHDKNAIYIINKNMVFSTSVLFLSFIAFLLGIVLARSGKSAGIIINISIFFLFYILEMFGESLYKSYGVIWSVWLPDIVLFILASYLFYKKSLR